jgi:hypothetical protein
MLRVSKRRELLAPPEIPKQRRAQNGAKKNKNKITHTHIISNKHRKDFKKPSSGTSSTRAPAELKHVRRLTKPLATAGNLPIRSMSVC